jgi:hypothetical protein
MYRPRDLGNKTVFRLGWILRIQKVETELLPDGSDSVKILETRFEHSKNPSFQQLLDDHSSHAQHKILVRAQKEYIHQIYMKLASGSRFYPESSF